MAEQPSNVKAMISYSNSNKRLLGKAFSESKNSLEEAGFCLFGGWKKKRRISPLVNEQIGYFVISDGQGGFEDVYC